MSNDDNVEQAVPFFGVSNQADFLAVRINRGDPRQKGSPLGEASIASTSNPHASNI